MAFTFTAAQEELLNKVKDKYELSNLWDEWTAHKIAA